MIKALFFDIDGTLVSFNTHEIPQSTVDALEQAKRNGVGVYGLQRGFKEAGVNTLMMSLWNVNDRATAIFMQDFYRLWLGGMTKREAFRTAVNNMRQQHREPFFWAAFTLLDAE